MLQLIELLLIHLRGLKNSNLCTWFGPGLPLPSDEMAQSGAAV